mmetsp:Transcript_39944/g.66271  ORF Transcript_39944/g.66271 Transcript_39944/m.66271 type:complete len:81 (+) Transcript_39944:93-335(+)
MQMWGPQTHLKVGLLTNMCRMKQLHVRALCKIIAPQRFTQVAGLLLSVQKVDARAAANHNAEGTDGAEANLLAVAVGHHA